VQKEAEKMTKKTVEQIGSWSEAKIRVVEEYAKAYSKVFAAKSQQKFHHCYIDASGNIISLT
jgi:hypothetical protein